MATFVKGEHVLANFGDGMVLAHVRKADPVTNAAGELKYVLQAPDGSSHRRPRGGHPAAPGSSVSCLPGILP